MELCNSMELFAASMVDSITAKVSSPVRNQRNPTESDDGIGAKSSWTQDKLQLSGSIKAPKTKLQHQRNPNFQAPNRSPRFELGTWSFFGVWSLVFGVSIPAFPGL